MPIYRLDFQPSPYTEGHFWAFAAGYDFTVYQLEDTKEWRAVANDLLILEDTYSPEFPTRQMAEEWAESFVNALPANSPRHTKARRFRRWRQKVVFSCKFCEQPLDDYGECHCLAR